jgi:hypothetical protein
MRAALLGVSIIFLGGFLMLTIHAALDRGLTVLTVLSLLIVGFMAIGILGAIWERFDDED